MNQFNIKYFIIVLLLNFLVLKNIKGRPNDIQLQCIHTIKTYYQIKIIDTTNPPTYIKFGMKNIRESVETLSGIKIIPSDDGKPENIPRTGKVNNFKDLIGRPPKTVYSFNDLVGNTAKKNYHTSDEGFSSCSSQGESSKSDVSKEIVVDYFNIPEEVKEYYLEFIPHLTNKVGFLCPLEYCMKNVLEENFSSCYSQITKSFNITDDLPSKEIILKLYKDYVIGELLSISQKYAIQYLKYVADNTKLQNVKESGKENMPSASAFCQKKNPAKTS